MGNIYCASCEHKCSDQAAACPKCGHPLLAIAKPATTNPTALESLTAAMQSRPPVLVRPVQQVQTIERTGKTWKLLQLVGVLLILGSFGACIVRAGAYEADGTSNGVWITLTIGVTLYIYGRVGGWWYHG